MIPINAVFILLHALSPGPVADTNYCEMPPPDLVEQCQAYSKPEPPRHRRDY